MIALTELPMATRDIRHKAIRAALKAAYLGVKFSVTGSRGTGYNWSRISWVDGPTHEQVNGIASQFMGSKFNGMTDGYDATGNTFTFDGVTYRAGGDGVNCERRLSAAYVRKLLPVIAEFWDRVAEVPYVEEGEGGYWTVRFSNGREARYERIRPDLEDTWVTGILTASEHPDRYAR